MWASQLGGTITSEEIAAEQEGSALWRSAVSYHRTVFNYMHVVILNCEFFLSSQPLNINATIQYGIIHSNYWNHILA